MKVVCWDFDGTIVHSRLLWSKCMLLSLKMLNSPVLPEIPMLREYTSTFYSWDNPYLDYTEFTGEKWWAYMNARFRECYLELGVPACIAAKAADQIRSLIINSDSYELYPDTVPALEAVRKSGHRNILLSNNHPDLRAITKRMGLYDFFDGFIISGEVGYDKPRAEIFAMAKTLFPSAEEYIMVGDNIIADILGGKSAGMTTIYVHKGYDEKADFCTDDLLFISKLL